MVDNCKALVTYVKQSKLQDQLSNTLKQENATRWNSMLRLLDSILSAWDSLVHVLTLKKQSHKLLGIDKDMLTELVAFLQPFQTATLALEVFKQPTIQDVCFYRHLLLEHCAVIREDITFTNEDGVLEVVKHKDTVSFVQLKGVVHGQIVKKFKLDNIHVVAAMLDPRFKGWIVTRFGVGNDQFEQARETLTMRMLKKGGRDQEATGEKPAASPKKKTRQSNSKYFWVGDRSKLSEQELEVADNVCGATESLQRHIEAELAMYLHYTITQHDHIILEKGGLLLWWQSKSVKNEGWPLIAQVACDVLCEPASSAKSECNFSDAGNTITKKRNQLQPDKVDDLMFLRSSLMSAPHASHNY